MEKINFQNLPNTTTPVNASNLNDLQDNVEDAIDAVAVSGSNSNGEYVKYADGRLEVWGQRSLGNVAITSSGGGVYNSSEQTSISYPYTFISAPPFRNISAMSGSGFYWITSVGSGTTTGTGGYYLTRGSSSTINNVVVCFHAMGRWK